MSKRRHSKRPDAVSKSPDLTANAIVDQAIKNILTRPAASVLGQIEDRRFHHPLGTFRPARTRSGHPVTPHKVKNFTVRPSRVVRGPGGRPMRRRKVVRVQTVPSRIRFDQPRRVLICIRRKVREEVLHALGRTGRGQKRRDPRRNAHSHISC